MLAIWKFALHVHDEQVIAMPVGARILDVQFQDGALFLWAVVKPDERLARRMIYMAGTGHPREPEVFEDYIGTVQEPNLPLVWHVFDGGEEVGLSAG